jgi:RimJ/RimL family protein N-acetyltransferase
MSQEHPMNLETGRLLLRRWRPEDRAPSSFTTVANVRSQAVMRRIGMTHDPADDFGHPRIAPDQPTHRHVLWRIKAPGRPEPG